MSMLMTDHDRALQAHERAYADMEAMRELHGRDSPEYRAAREDVLAAVKELRPALDRSRPTRERCPTCGKPV